MLVDNITYTTRKLSVIIKKFVIIINIHKTKVNGNKKRGFLTNLPYYKTYKDIF